MQQSQLNIALMQSHLVWENPSANRKNFEVKIKNIKKPVDLIILPEMFSTGFTMNAPLVAETMNGKTVVWMQQMAAKTNAALVGSLVIKENQAYYNRLLFALPSGEIVAYDKRHTFTLAGEGKVYAKGTSKRIVNYKGWSICPQICYDLRFPVWARNTEYYDVLLYVANWPTSRINAWNALLKARAIENMCYVVGVNRIGQDEKQNQYPGHSAVYNVLGETITNLKPNQEQTEIVILEKNHIADNRNKFRFLDDGDGFEIL
ncbi:MAG: amidohydrolase [Flavobacteriaceae bacterium]